MGRGTQDIFTLGALCIITSANKLYAHNHADRPVSPSPQTQAPLCT